MKIVVQIPQIEDYREINELAKQVHKLHVNWRPDLFLDVDEIINKEYLENLIKNKSIFVAKVKNKIVGYVIINIKEKNNPNMIYRKQLSIEAICVDKILEENVLVKYTKTFSP